MRIAAVSTFVAATLIVATPALTAAQTTGTLAADVQADWQGQKAQIMGIADAMPADMFS